MTPKKPQHDLVRRTLTRAFKERRLVIVGTTGDKTITLPKGIAHCALHGRHRLERRR